MKPTRMKLVDVILRRIEEGPDVGLSESGLRTWLQGQGYNKRDIDAAMKLVRPRFAPERRVAPFPKASVRKLAPHEEQRLSPEARNTLMRLQLCGLIEPQELEMVLDRLNQFEGEVGLGELDYLLSWLVCGFRDVETQRAIYGVLEGGDTVRH